MAPNTSPALTHFPASSVLQSHAFLLTSSVSRALEEHPTHTLRLLSPLTSQSSYHPADLAHRHHLLELFLCLFTLLHGSGSLLVSTALSTVLALVRLCDNGLLHQTD